jgi:hypothetical protein
VSHALDEGRQTFRYETFGDQVFWSRTLKIQEALKTVSPWTALAVGLKVDAGTFFRGSLYGTAVVCGALPPDRLRARRLST